jgi:hydrogenase nickel incorporation protein HypB
LEQDILARNDAVAAANRRWLAARHSMAVNLMSSPGSGKTTLLERTIRDLDGDVVISVIEGDQATAIDAERIEAAGAPVLQVNTGAGCHLDAAMVDGALRRLSPPEGSVVMIENIGNLVCPALFDLGESGRAVIMSVTEGDDKPLKYPHMFRSADAVVLNKVDLLPHVDFDVERCVASVRRLRPGTETMALSATTGEGLDQWYGWLRQRVAGSRSPRVSTTRR